MKTMQSDRSATWSSWIIRTIFFRLDPEEAHRRAISLLSAAGRSHLLCRAARRFFEPRARPVRLMGLVFPSRLGLAAGFDKDARALWGTCALGFGFVEVGSVTALPWQGNSRPRLFRIPEAGALVNRMGLPSEGVDVVAGRLARKPPFPVLVNVAKTADPAISGDAAVADIRTTVERISPLADAIVLNLCCPNTPDGRTFQEPEALRELLEALAGSIQGGGGAARTLVKLSPDLDRGEVEAVVSTALAGGVRGFVATNTSARGMPATDLPAGGLSGSPIRDKAIQVVRWIRDATGPGPMVIGCGGLRTKDDLTAFLDAGADLVEAYTGFIYEGPSFCKRVLR